MQYLGGKSRIASELVPVIESYRKESQVFVEPFCGGANITCKVKGERHAYDSHKQLIAMYNALQKGWIPPSTVSKEEYDRIKINGSDELKGFVGFGCSFSGKYFGGYAKNKRGDNFAMNAHNSLLRKMSTMRDVVFGVSDYKDLKYNNSLIYCDPPYSDTTGYSNGSFDSLDFWDWCRCMSNKGNTVLTSEYKAPDDFKCVWEKKTKTEIRTKNNGREDRIEKLFIAPF